MHSEARPAETADVGLLSPVSAGFEQDTADAVVLRHLIEVEDALTRAWADVGVAPADAADAVSAALDGARPDVAELARAARSGGNPVIPLVHQLRARVGGDAARWVHRGATSQDVLDSALMLTARRAGERILSDLRTLEGALSAFAAAHRDQIAAARTLTQHAVPTTTGLRAATWLRGVSRARTRLADVVTQLPAQLAGAGGTLASLAEIGGADAASALPAVFAARLGLAAPEHPWHTTRWPVTELGDALVQVADGLGVIAADVATLSRTEIAELAEGSTGGSSAMPHKRNPAASVLVRSAAIRAPHLGATLHTAAALAVDERPDGAWHAEWPALRELLRTVRGAAGTAAELVAGLRVDDAAVARNLAATGGLIVSERLALRLGGEALAEILRRSDAGEPLRDAVRAVAGTDADELLDPAGYTGLAARLVDETLAAVDAVGPRGTRERS